MNVLSVLTEAAKMSDTEQSSSLPYDIERDQECKEFYHGARATRIPEDILTRVIKHIFPNFDHIDPQVLAGPLYNEDLVTFNEFCTITNDRISLVERINTLLYKVLPSKGDQRNTIVRFYRSLLKSGVPQSIATDLRCVALRECGTTVVTQNLPGVRPLDEMVERLEGKCVAEDLAKDFAKSLGVAGNELGDVPVTELRIIAQIWIHSNPNQCTPVGFVEALVCTKGLGKFASGIGFPSNPPDVKSFFLNLGEKWWNVATFLGYSKDELESVVTELHNTYDQMIASFLTAFKMPDCGASTLPILHRAAQKAGISGTKKQWSQGPFGLPGHFQLPDGLPTLDTYDDEVPKPKPPPAHPGAATKSQGAGLHPWSFPTSFIPPPPPWARAFPWARPPPWAQTLLRALVGAPPQFFHDHHPHYSQWEDVQQRAYYESFQSHAEWHRSHPGASQTEVGGYEYATFQPQSSTPTEASAQPSPSSSLQATGAASYVAPSNEPLTSGATPINTQQTGKHGFKRDNTDDLIQSCRKGDANAVEIVGTLIDSTSGANLDVQTEDDGSHPIHLAVMSKSFQMLSLIVPYYNSLGKIDVVRDDHKTALMVACIEKNHDFVRLLIESEADVNAKDCDGLSCLHLKETLESPDIVQLLIDNGAIVDNPTDANNLTPLTHACLIGQAQSAKVLLASKANPDGLPGALTTPLCVAAGAGQEQIVQTLLDYHAKVDIQEKDGSTPLLKACKSGHVDIASMLINANTDKSIPDKQGNTPIIASVESHYTELLQLLLACKADPNQFKVVCSGNPPREYEVTPLAAAAGRGKLDMVEILVKNEANVNYCSERTLSAICYAVGCGHTNVVEFFLKNNEVRKSIEGLSTPLTLAINSGDQHIIKVLLDALGGSEKALHQATEASMTDLVGALCRLNERDQRRSTFAENGGSPDASNYAPFTINEREVHETIDKTLREFLKVAITTAELKQSREFILEEASKGDDCDHIVLFFEQYFTNPEAVPDMFGQFINVIPPPSPAYFLFENEKLFDGATLKLVLEQMESTVMEYLPVALMQFPGLEEQLRVDGAGILALLMGPRFNEAVQKFGLLTAAKPSIVEASASAENVPTPTPHFGDTDRDSCSPQREVGEFYTETPPAVGSREKASSIPGASSTASGEWTSYHSPTSSSTLVEPQDEEGLFQQNEEQRTHPPEASTTQGAINTGKEDATMPVSTPYHNAQEKKSSARRPSRIPRPLYRLKSVPSHEVERKPLAQVPRSASPRTHMKKEPSFTHQGQRTRKNGGYSHGATDSNLHFRSRGHRKEQLKKRAWKLVKVSHTLSKVPPSLV